MKTYIFIVMNICGIGGSEQYLHNKTQYLLKNGYKVYVFSGMNGKIMIDSLKKYEKDIIPSLMYSPCFFKKTEVEKTLLRMKKKVVTNFYEPVIIESDGIAEAKWGELLAQSINGKHIQFNVQESHNYTKEEKLFLKFKLKRKELFGITESSVGQMFGNNLIYKDTVFSAYCNNVVQNCEDNYSHLLNQNADYTIGTIGRLDKECVEPVIREIVCVAQKMASCSFNVLLIGGTNSKKVRRNVYELFKFQKNINLVITGAIYPIPRNLIKKVDVFVSTAGSAVVSYMEKIPTIKVHPISGLPCGLIGYDCSHDGDMYSVNDNMTVSDLIDDVLAKRKIPAYIPNLLKDYNDNMNLEFDRQLRLSAQKQKNQYYNVNLTNYKVANLKILVYYILGKTVGGVKMQFVLDKLRVIFK